MGITLIANICPKNDAFVGMVSGNQVIGSNLGGEVSVLPSSCISTNSLSERYLRISNAPTDGQFLQYKDASDLTWAAAGSSTFSYGWAKVSDAGTIAHGLGIIPTWFSICPSGTTPFMYICKADITNITIFHSSPDDEVFSWIATTV
jgi:hypothetical protein